MGDIISEAEVLLGTALWLKESRGVLPYRLSVARGAGIDQRADQERIARTLREANIPSPLLSFSASGPDLVGVSRGEWWQLECKGAGAGKSQTLRNNFDRALASAVSYFSARVPSQLSANEGIRPVLGLALADVEAYSHFATTRIPHDLQTALNLWVLFVASDGSISRICSPRDARVTVPSSWRLFDSGKLDERDKAYRGETWKEVVLGGLQVEGGVSVALDAIYGHVAAAELVTTYHLDPWRPGGQPRFQCWTRRALTDLVREGQVVRVGRGMYSLASGLSGKGPG